MIKLTDATVDIKEMKGGQYRGEVDSNGKACGDGVFTLEDGGTYTGTWYRNKFHGYGIFTDVEGKREGEWKEGKRHGKQTKYWNGNGWISNRLYNMDKCESMTQVSEPEQAWFGDG